MSSAVIIGYAPYHIPIYKNTTYYEKNYIVNKGKQGSKYAGFNYGKKYQCVELVRRWLMHARNITFPEVAAATDIFKLTHGIDITTHKNIPFKSIINDGEQTPLFGDIIIWKKQGENKNYGHCAIVADIVSPAIVTIAEQNGKAANGVRNIIAQNQNILGWLRPDV